ncbi:hypothetical protein [Photobacterium satsumensis]|uniref:hypothetical protein n=1 Tax=Photobacterium satsumensis TaxID=2910239 RepID=UPI003D105EE2
MKSEFLILGVIYVTMLFGWIKDKLLKSSFLKQVHNSAWLQRHAFIDNLNGLGRNDLGYYVHDFFVTQMGSLDLLGQDWTYPGINFFEMETNDLECCHNDRAALNHGHPFSGRG